MRVGEVIALLQEFDPDTPVHFAYNYGDYWRTTVAPEVEQVDKESIKFSGYHNMPAIATETELAERYGRYQDLDADDVPPLEEDGITEVVVLRAIR